MRVGEFGGVGEVGGCAGDVVACWEEECGGWFGDGDGGEAWREVGGKRWRGAAHGAGRLDCANGGGRDGGGVDGGLIVEEDEDVVEGGAEFVGEDLQLEGVVVDHGENVLFQNCETFA